MQSGSLALYPGGCCAATEDAQTPNQARDQADASLTGAKKGLRSEAEPHLGLYRVLVQPESITGFKLLHVDCDLRVGRDTAAGPGHNRRVGAGGRSIASVVAA